MAARRTASLPPGITLSWDGRLAGTEPTATGTFGFQRVCSASPAVAAGATAYPSGSDSRAYALTVRP